jgi:UDP-3-O-[3-hydroxymyristoyl] glucosamine N-acyltransferase
MLTLGELAERFDLTLSGDSQRPVSRLATLSAAGEGEVSFLANKKYLSQLRETRAAAVILRHEHVADCPVDSLACDDPYLAYARVTALFAPAAGPAGVHPAAVVSPEATVEAGAIIGPNAVIEPGAFVGSGAQVGANVYVGHDSRVGAGSCLYPGAVLYRDVQLGENCIVHSQAVLGGDGFGFAPAPDGWQKIHQLGGVRIGDNVEIGACTTVDRGALEHTVLEDGVILDNQVHIAHNCHIGKNTAIAGCTGLAGSTIIGANCTFAGGVGVAGHIEICDGVHVTGMSIVTKSITKPGAYSSGTPMSPSREWRKNAVRFTQLERMHQRLAALEKQGD